MARKTLKSRRLNMETLENRSMLAGNVIAKVTSGNLTITGDNQANLIEITADSAGKFTIKGTTNSNTTINGKANDSFTVTGNVTITMAGGADKVVLGTSSADTKIPKSLSINLNSGADTLTMNRVKTVVMNVNAGSDTEVEVDTLAFVNCAHTGDVTVALGAGNDKLNTTNWSTTTKLTVNGNRGADTFTASSGIAAQDAVITMGLDSEIDNDIMTLKGLSVSRNATLNMGGGDDKLYLPSNTFPASPPAADYLNVAGLFTINLGKGNDTSIFGPGTVGATGTVGTLAFNFGDGNDTVKFRGPLTIKNVHRIDGGLGTDTIVKSGTITVTGQNTIINVENPGNPTKL
jgi:copper(I)-binding protein